MNKSLKDTSNEELINSYIGKNVDDFRNNNFSIYMFFFGFMYLSYRKMWLAGFIWFLFINFVIVIPHAIGIIVILLAKILISTQFNKLYLKYVEKQVNKIKRLNEDKTKDELIAICNRKGGVNQIPILILTILGIIVSVSVVDFGILFIFNILTGSSTPY